VGRRGSGNYSLSPAVYFANQPTWRRRRRQLLLLRPSSLAVGVACSRGGNESRASRSRSMSGKIRYLGYNERADADSIT